MKRTWYKLGRFTGCGISSLAVTGSTSVSAIGSRLKLLYLVRTTLPSPLYMNIVPYARKFIYFWYRLEIHRESMTNVYVPTRPIKPQVDLDVVCCSRTYMIKTTINKPHCKDARDIWMRLNRCAARERT